MAKGFRELAVNAESRVLEYAEGLGLLVEQEATLRQQRRFAARARIAKLRRAATIEDVDYRTQRSLDRMMFLRLGGLRLDPRASTLPDNRSLWGGEVVVGLYARQQTNYVGFRG